MREKRVRKFKLFHMYVIGFSLQLYTYKVEPPTGGLALKILYLKGQISPVVWTQYFFVVVN